MLIIGQAQVMTPPDLVSDPLNSLITFISCTNNWIQPTVQENISFRLTKLINFFLFRDSRF